MVKSSYVLEVLEARTEIQDNKLLETLSNELIKEFESYSIDHSHYNVFQTYKFCARMVENLKENTLQDMKSYQARVIYTEALAKNLQKLRKELLGEVNH